MHSKVEFMYKRMCGRVLSRILPSNGFVLQNKESAMILTDLSRSTITLTYSTCHPLEMEDSTNQINDQTFNINKPTVQLWLIKHGTWSYLGFVSDSKSKVNNPSRCQFLILPISFPTFLHSECWASKWWRRFALTIKHVWNSHPSTHLSLSLSPSLVTSFRWASSELDWISTVSTYKQ